MDQSATPLPILAPSAAATRGPALPVLESKIYDSPAMICRNIFDEISVHANGDIVCSCADPTGVRVYGNVFVDRLADVFNGPMYQEMRQWQLRAAPDSFCPVSTGPCSKRIARATAVDEPIGQVVKFLQLEPVTYCNLRCPSCPVTSHFDLPEHAHRGYQMLPLEVMLDVVDQLPDVDTLLFYTYGEPFLHKDAIEFLRTVKRKRPQMYIATNTNGLVFTSDQIHALAKEALMDKIVFSIDGAEEASYRTYRVGGDLSKALANLQALVDLSKAAGTFSRIEIEWQYILFEWNDSDAELARARDLAKEIGVPINWLLTHTVGASKRILPGSVEFERLCEGKMASHPMSKELEFEEVSKSAGSAPQPRMASIKLEKYWQPGGICQWSHLDSAQSEMPRLEGGPEDILTLTVRVENKSDHDWRSDKPGAFRLGLALRASSGKRIEDLPPVSLPAQAIPAGGVLRTTFQVVLPQIPGEYQILIDVIEERVAWFSEQGSQALVLRLKVHEATARYPFV